MYQEVLEAFSELKSLLERKKEAIIHKNLDELARCDEDIVILSEKINKFDINALKDTFGEEQKQELKKLGERIKVLEENNEILIKHSIGVINNILSGILNIAANDKTSYNAKGVSCTDSETLDISSITEEA
ncbi:MAG: hypothetical protein IJ877_03275 [Candidatus Gastranaerophilales bacterium]|nr:hypothetical protein [Candidatus Gastranaerophilales bacterium]